MTKQIETDDCVHYVKIIGDGFHYIMECSFSKHKMILIKQKYEQIPNNKKFISFNKFPKIEHSSLNSVS